MRRITIGLFIALLTSACSSSSNSGGQSPGNDAGSGGSSGNPSSSGGGGDTSCTITFGGDAATVTATSCSLLGPFVSDSTALTFSGSVSGLDAPIFALTVKYPNGVTAKTYETKDIAYVSANISVTATGKIYDLDYDASDASKTRDGTITTVFTSDKHGTIEATYDDTDDTPASHATVKITF